MFLKHKKWHNIFGDLIVFVPEEYQKEDSKYGLFGEKGARIGMTCCRICGKVKEVSISSTI